MLARDQNRPLKSEADGITWRPKRPGVGNGYAIVDVQFTLSAVVEQAECRVAALLNLGEHDAGADRVDGAGRNEDDIAFRNRTPLNQINDRAIRDRRAQFLWRDPPVQADADLRARFRRDDVPCFALAVRHPHRARKRIVRMDLDRQRRAGEQQFEKQGRDRRIACRRARTRALPPHPRCRRCCSMAGDR